MERLLDASIMEILSPISMSTVIVWHILFLWQWNKRQRRKAITVNYRIVIEKKRFHRLWMALLSHPEPTTSFLETCRFLGHHHHHPAERISDRVVEMGHDDDSSHYSRRATFDRFREMLLVRIDRWMTRASLGAAPLLLYNCHIVWSCRALEEEYNLPFQSRWNYARILLCWGILAYGTELALYQILIRRLEEVAPRSSYNYQTTNHHPLASFRTKLLDRPLSTTPTSLTATLLLVFHLQYPYVAPQIIPWLRNLQFLSPSVSYFLCILMLMLVSPQSLTTIAISGLVGLFWWYTEFLVQPYWNIPFCGAFVVLTCLSARVNYGKDWVPCFDRVAWNSNGTLLVPNDQGEWIPMTDDSSVSSEESDEAPDEERVGSRIPDDDDDDDDVEVSADRQGNPWTELVPLSRDWATQMRSRRGTNIQ
ncbi:hypothetical protein FisN_14Lh242 [Fistulifera solaris]|uniref:Uncharacterized protein n=1 Tax=Fistulifera solaris TaxID=1519565 RepID=A0A1Z5J9T8_FISSO|nr:hypothetical protein FisN_14Lh242 [Fistulifera solaris]|eukprot:GAX10726.1 hypothetical protein FisN_14Lh242 [Fistulifera solaris]